jgi:hypothetical protein
MHTGMLHEKQTRQLCAVHTVNNLLQLPSGSGCDGSFDCADDDAKDLQIHTWTCDGRVLHQYRQPSSTSISLDKCWCAATQSEFDKIAQQVTIRERQLMNGDVSDAMNKNDGTTSSTNDSLSTWQRTWSHHVTPFFGNYSCEVIQLALTRRGVSLDYFHVPEEVADAQVGTSSSESATSTPIGYVVYEQGNSYSSYLKQMGGYIPIVKHFCQGKHWYAITRVKYTCSHSNDPTKLNQQEATYWYIIDSKLNDERVIESDEQLMDVLKGIQNKGGLVFRAHM